MNLSSNLAITNEDVIEFERALKRENRNLTREKARESLIRSGVLDTNGDPTWPINGDHKPKGKSRSKK